jgi:hypothetical protein
MSETENPLQSLKIRDLTAILKHIRLGKDHLNQALSPDEMDDLLDEGRLKKQQRENIKSDKQEKAGNIALVLNTILTSCLGAWLGFSGFTHQTLDSYITIIVIFMAIVLGALVGYLSYQFTYRQAEDATSTQKLFNIQLTVIQTIIEKRREIIRSLEKNIKILINLLLDKPRFNAEEANSDNVDKYDIDYLEFIAEQDSDCTPLKKNIFYHVHHLVNEKVTTFYEETMVNQLIAIRRITIKLLSRIEHCNREEKYYPKKSTKSSVEILSDSTHTSYLKTLTKSNLSPRRMVPSVRHWLKNNILTIALGLMPTLLGGFASMFVFLDGIPDIFKQFHINHHLGPHGLYYVKHLSLLLAGSLTIYYGYSHIHTNYKAFKRAKQLEHTERKIAEESEKLMHQVTILHLMIKLKYMLNQLKIIYQTVELLPHDKEHNKKFPENLQDC